MISYEASSSDFTEPASKMIANAPDVIFQISSTADLIGFAQAYQGAAFTPALALCYTGGFQQDDFLSTALDLGVEFYSGTIVCPDTLYDDGDEMCIRDRPRINQAFREPVILGNGKFRGFFQTFETVKA